MDRTFLFATFERIISLECLELLSGITCLLDGLKDCQSNMFLFKKI